jgi:hypothetical protein
MNSNDEQDLARFRRTEDRRKRQRQIAYQNTLPQGPTPRELEIAALDRWDAIWKRTRNGY